MIISGKLQAKLTGKDYLKYGISRRVAYPLSIN
jgi:hypothetical protein